MAQTIPFFSGFATVLGFYIAATLAYVLRVLLNKKILSAIALRVTLAGVVLHLFFLTLHFIRQGYPFLVTSFDSFQLTSLAIIFVFSILSLAYRFSVTGVILLPFSLFFFILSFKGVIDYRLISPFLGNPWAFTHLIFIFLSLAVFMVGFVVGMIYLIQEYRIKRKLSGGIFDRFPPLETLDQVHSKSLWAGFIFFTIGIITGAGWSKSTLGLYVTNNITQVLSFVVWIFFAVFLNWRIPKGWIGKRGILLSGLSLGALAFLLFWNRH